MSSQFNERIRELFDQVLERPTDERTVFLELECGEDAQLLEAVQRLLRARESPDSFLQTGTVTSRIGRYAISGELGRGAMGIVYDAFDPLIGRNVALKVIRLKEAMEPHEAEFLRDRLFREARLAGQLFHPGIVVILDVGQERDTAFVAMERVEGQTLQRILDGGDLLATSRVLGILQQTGVALDFAHQHGVVHCDIKPANIILQNDSEVKITDFGIARVISQTLTLPGTVMGTPSYMSPEQLEGRPVDGRGDQFSLAVLAYELLTGQRPFHGDSLATLTHAIVNGKRPSARAANPELPAAIDRVLQRGLAKFPQQRYQNCVELVTQIDSALRYPKLSWKVGYATITLSACLAVGVGILGYRKLVSRPDLTSPPRAEVASVRPAITNPTIQSFTVEPLSIEAGSVARLSWRVSDATGVEIDHGLGSVPSVGIAAVAPAESTTYKLSASGHGPEVHASVAIEVKKTDPQQKSISPEERGRELYDLASEKRQSGLLSEAVALLRQAAEFGDTRAMVELGEMYRDEEGVLRNNAEAILWFRKAAEAGRAAGMVDLGAMYLLGDGVAVSEQEAAKWFEKAAAAGSGAGMYDLASLYETGRGVPQNLQKAIELYRGSANHGNTEASRRLTQIGVR